MRCIQMADPFEVPSSPFFQSDLTIPIDRSATLFDWWWNGELDDFDAGIFAFLLLKSSLVMIVEVARIPSGFL